MSIYGGSAEIQTNIVAWRCIPFNLTDWSTPEDGSTPTRDVRSIEEA